MNYQPKPRATILLIENDDQTRRLLIKHLQNSDYQVLLAVDEENAIEWLLTNEKINIDLILMNQVQISRQECQSAIAKIYQQTSLPDTIPSVIMAEHYQTALEGTEEKIDENQYIIYLEDIEHLLTFIQQVFQFHSH